MINDVYDVMPGKKARTVLFTNDKTIMQNYDYYAKYYQSKGWKAYLGQINSEIGSQALSYSQENKDVNIVIYEQDGQTVVLYNEVTEGR